MASGVLGGLFQDGSNFLLDRVEELRLDCGFALEVLVEHLANHPDGLLAASEDFRHADHDAHVELVLHERGVLLRGVEAQNLLLLLLEFLLELGLGSTVGVAGRALLAVLRVDVAQGRSVRGQAASRVEQHGLPVALVPVVKSVRSILSGGPSRPPRGLAFEQRRLLPSHGLRGDPVEGSVHLRHIEIVGVELLLHSSLAEFVLGFPFVKKQRAPNFAGLRPGLRQPGTLIILVAQGEGPKLGLFVDGSVGGAHDSVERLPAFVQDFPGEEIVVLIFRWLRGHYFAPTFLALPIILPNIVRVPLLRREEARALIAGGRLQLGSLCVHRTVILCLRLASLLVQGV